jgi:hypothetical protein
LQFDTASRSSEKLLWSFTRLLFPPLLDVRLYSETLGSGREKETRKYAAYTNIFAKRSLFYLLNESEPTEYQPLIAFLPLEAVPLKAVPLTAFLPLKAVPVIEFLLYLHCIQNILQTNI